MWRAATTWRSTERRIIAIALGNVRCYANGQSLDNRMPLKG